MTVYMVSVVRQWKYRDSWQEDRAYDIIVNVSTTALKLKIPFIIKGNSQRADVEKKKSEI